MPKIARAIISLSDKTGILPLAQALARQNIEILSTGGTAKLLRDNKIPVDEVSDATGQPEILDGRLKTLHPKIHGGILAIRSNPQHQAELKKSGIKPIDLVIVNLYPFEETIQKPEVSLQEAIENIDIGGPTMLRAAAKNWQEVTVVCDPADYPALIAELETGQGTISPETNFRLAQKVFALTARYDGAIANYLTGGREQRLPDVLTLQVQKIQDLRYGENPHQRGAFYTGEGGRRPGEGAPRQLHGKELSFNNFLDLDAAASLLREFQPPACVIIKHTNPCGVALTPSPSPAGGRGVFVAARACDPLSAFGGIVGLNRTVDRATAEEIGKDFYECVIAPDYAPEALEILKAKKNIRLMEWTPSPPRELDLKKIAGGLLVQDPDRLTEGLGKSKVVTKRTPTEAEWQALEFAWKVCAHVKSNAIVIAGEESGVRVTFGIGCGQMSRIDSVKLAIAKMTSPPAPPLLVCLASDAFFPFRDNVDEAARAGVKAIIQPGGSLKDQESIDAANQHGIAMVFTGVRHFRH